MSSLFRYSLALLAAMAGHAHAQQGAPTPAQASASPAAISRVLTLADLGYTDGVSFRQMNGQATLYVPLAQPQVIRDGVLRLQLRQGETLPADRYLQVRLGERIVASRSLQDAGDAFVLPIAFEPEDVTNGFLVVTITYSGAISDHVCIDDRASGDFVSISPQSTLELELTADAVDSPMLFSMLRPSEMRVLLSETDSLAGLAAATRAAVLFGAQSGQLHFGPDDGGQDDAGPDGRWAEGVVNIEPTSSGAAVEMSVSNAAGLPELTLRGSDPQIGLWQLASEWNSLADTQDVVTDRVELAQPDLEALPLAVLDADLAPREVVGTSEVLVPFSINDLPSNKTVAAVDLQVAAALDPEGRGATASVYLNNTLLGNRPLSSGLPERLLFDVADGLIGRDNLLRIVIQRQPVGGECRFRPQGYPAQVLPGSVLRLSDRADGSDDFFHIQQDFGAGVQLVLDPDSRLDIQSAMPWIAGVAGSLIPGKAPVVPRGTVDAIEPGMPFLVVSKNDPGDEKAAVTFDEGQVQIRDSDDEVIYSGEDLERLGIVQIVSRNGERGVWLRPGDGPQPVLSPQRPLVLDRGDLALVGEQGVQLVTSMDRAPLIQVTYPEQQSLAQLFAKYRPWVVGGLWVLLTIAVLGFFQRIYSRRKSSSGS
ncbi:cellulose biosynthesis cyclic di-GMP-binding regulatory protein BcsB [Paracoccus sp. 1_MG-2023]|uniref:cellulose biosynthesis cyclic di-GMP-binding regulatory protein BcsB n=1 Tax=unclassified Paracoccus (in: a-proteobacteria) TaxID=2688777 RepID=UPI001C09DF3C|nr:MULTISPECIES: cellulose biosynthesis cyclic di-GMP-binding regulatory protein BcsB [unclassified Paracoccus (in: a-proteobacteria)]MBU2959181.1 cellulose biosynthesis cyclic di-GMP-binding regulatory protein BcsB [Paracoccus sp. C2R09]MDO6670082.1 cellulose biosynthesis cyclic di-GMP-binding regulatory protein BcsB [Paracoccus sp. 1_MG-2023]